MVSFHLWNGTRTATATPGRHPPCYTALKMPTKGGVHDADEL